MFDASQFLDTRSFGEQIHNENDTQETVEF